MDLNSFRIRVCVTLITYHFLNNFNSLLKPSHPPRGEELPAALGMLSGVSGSCRLLPESPMPAAWVLINTCGTGTCIWRTGSSVGKSAGWSLEGAALIQGVLKQYGVTHVTSCVNRRGQMCLAVSFMVVRKRGSWWGGGRCGCF